MKWCALRAAVSDEDGAEQPVYHAGASYVDVLRDAPGGIWRALEADS